MPVTLAERMKSESNPLRRGTLHHLLQDMEYFPKYKKVRRYFKLGPFRIPWGQRWEMVSPGKLTVLRWEDTPAIVAPDSPQNGATGLTLPPPPEEGNLPTKNSCKSGGSVDVCDPS